MNIDTLRHGESVFNKYGTSGKDCSLTEKGIEQAFQISGHYDIIICSILRRCKETLENSKLSANEYIYSDLCREYKIDICDFLVDEPIIKETLEEFEARVNKFKEFIKQFNSKKVLVVSHGDFIFYLNSKIVCGERFGDYPDNCQIITIEL